MNGRTKGKQTQSACKWSLCKCVTMWDDDDETVGGSPLLPVRSDARGGRTLRGKQAQGTGKWSLFKCAYLMRKL